MTPAFYNISIWKGSTKNLEFRFPFSLNGYTANLTYRLSGNNVTIPFSVQLHSLDPLVWSTTSVLTKESTAVFTEGRKINYEFKLTIGTNEATYIYGNLIVEGPSSGV